MRYMKYALRLLVVALFALALLTPVLPAYITTIADARPASAAANDNERNDNDDEDGDERDPCRKALKRAAKGKLLPPGCHPGGSGGASKGDFNGDGFADLAVGAPHEDVDGVGGVGAVNIIYGSSTGLSATATPDQVFYETNFGYALASGDHLGSALAAGDFNGDTFSDLAIGVPDRNLGSDVNAGIVVLIDGSANGLNSATARTLSLLGGGKGRAGAALVWADFNGDAFGDLAVGIPERDFFPWLELPLFDVGEVQVFYGSLNGLTQLGALHLTQGRVDNECGTYRGVGDEIEPRGGDRFGSVLAAGNFRLSSPFADLVVGVPSEDFSLTGPFDVGIVHIIAGSLAGLCGPGSPVQVLSQDTAGVGGGAETGDQFGFALATGDFDGDLRDDLAVGSPGEDLTNNTEADAGVVHVFFGNIFGGNDLVDAASNVFISFAPLPGVNVEPGDYLGWSLAVGRFNNDGFDDLAIGAPGKNVGSTIGAGLVAVLYGSSSGPSFTNFQLWSQDSTGIQDTAEPYDRFGWALSAWNYGKSSQSDLAIGVPLEDFPSGSFVNGIVDAGAVNVIYGSGVGLTSTGNQFWHQGASGVNDATQPDDRFGQTLY